MAAGVALTLPEILLVEDSAEILSFKCPVTGWLAWPAVRHVFLSYLIHELAYEWAAFIGPLPKPWHHHRAAAALLKAARHNREVLRRGVLRRPIMIFGTTSTMVQRDGMAFNRLSDDFALQYPEDTVVIEDLFPLQYSVPRNRRNPDVLYSLPELALRKFRSAMINSGPFDAVANGLTRFLTARVKQLFGLQLPLERQGYFTTIISRNLRRFQLERRRFHRLFERANPRILLVMAGTTGGHAPSIQVAREMGITVAEYQHGQFGAGQPEYNFAPTLLASDAYRATLPEYLLTYGRWWTKKINAPLHHVVIGNPHRAESLLLHRKPLQAGPPEILIVAKLGEATKYLELAGKLDHHFDGRYRIRLRANPRDRNFGGHSSITWQGRTIELDCNPDFYASLVLAHTIVSGPSTVLAESIGIANRIFIWDEVGGPFKYPDQTFERFRSVNELIAAIESPAGDCPDRPEVDELWAPDWRQRYSGFVKQFIA
ncbi:hypothetical protein [Bradyrhizobium sp.]|uniref:hypothetical protein n=1 Tax=Bradyrhizobium sp. TaxID=376 RepID=UPI001DB18E38|nr:hypothetical protein [Bradyrhizobium sp.]MBI5321037.1 hypothetical protein [Bradyrhizobium sp.]